MSAPTNPTDAVVPDPLVEALERLERSMSPRVRDHSGDVRPAPTRDPGGGSEAARAAPAPPPTLQRSEPPAEVEPAPQPEPRPAPTPPTARPAPEIEIARRHATARAASGWAEAAPAPAAAPVPIETPSWDVPDPEDLLRVADADAAPDTFDPPAAPAPIARARNKRTDRTASTWGAVVLAGVAQLIVLAIAAAALWPTMKQSILDEAARSRPAPTANPATPARLDAIDEQLTSLERHLRASPADAWRELEFLGERNALLALADRAIFHADRAAFDQLVGLAADAEDDRIRAGAEAELTRVRQAYASGLRPGSYHIPVGQLFPSMKERGEGDLGLDRLVQVLLDPAMRPEYRTKAAYLLADHRCGRAADALASAVASDANLDVVREAAMTFCEMTSYRTEDLLDSAALGRWWELKADWVKAALGR